MTSDIVHTISFSNKFDVSKINGEAADYTIAKVYGRVLHMIDNHEYIAVACPFCHRVHLHGATRHPISTFVPPGVQADTRVEHQDTPDTLNKVTWETDRVALCKKGTYHIVGN